MRMWIVVVLVVSAALTLGAVLGSDESDRNGAGFKAVEEFLSVKRQGRHPASEVVGSVDRFLRGLTPDVVRRLTEYELTEVLAAVAWRRDADTAIRLLGKRYTFSPLVRERLQDALFVSTFKWIPRPEAADPEAVRVKWSGQSRGAAALVWAKTLTAELTNWSHLASSDRKRILAQLCVLAETEAFPRKVQAALLDPFVGIIFAEPVTRSDLRGIVALALGSFDSEIAAWRKCLDKIEAGQGKWDNATLEIALGYSVGSFKPGIGKEAADRLTKILESSKAEARKLVCVCLMRLGRPHGVEALLDLLEVHESDPTAPFIKEMLSTLLEVDGGLDKDAEWWRRKARRGNKKSD